MAKKLVYSGQFSKVYQEGNKYVVYYKRDGELSKVSSHAKRENALLKAKAINKKTKDLAWWDR